MATFNKKFVVKNGLQTQNIDFVSPDTTNTIQVSMLDTDTLSFSGDSGQLFSITDSLSGTIFAVNDISGVPSIEVDDDGTIRLAETFGNVLIGTATDDGTNKLQVDGTISATGFAGDVTGNADTATQLETARTISLGGVLSGSASFDGSSDITITASHTSDPTITLTGAVTGSGTMTNLGNVTIATTATADPTLTIDGDASGSATFTNLGNATLTLTVADDSHNHSFSSGNFTVNGGSLTVGSGTNSSTIYMTDADESTRRIQTNSGRIGFLDTSLNWSAYSKDDGDWIVEGKLGVGTNTPASLLHVEGTTTGTGSEPDAIAYFKQNGGWDGNEPWALYVEGYSYLNGFRINAADGVRALYKTASGGTLGFAVAGDDPITFTQSTSTERMRIDAGGNVGVGTTSPIRALHVVGSPGDTALFGGINAGTGTENIGGIQLGTITDIANRRVWGIKSESTNQGMFGVWVSADNASSAFSGTQVVSIDRTGNVGINNTNPLGKLSVYTTSLNSATGYNGQNFGIVVGTDDQHDAGDNGNGIVFTQQYATDAVDASQVRTGAVIGYKAQGTGSFGGGLKFLVQPTGGVPMETAVTVTKDSKVLITSSGTIGTTTPGNGYLQLTDGSDTMAFDPNEIYSTTDIIFTTGGNVGIGSAANRVFADDYHPNADKWTTGRTITLTGDVTGTSGAFDGSGNLSFATAIASNAVALGTNTTGAYVATISGTANEIEVSGSGSETAAVTIGLPNDVTIGNNLTVTGNLIVNGTTTTVNSTTVTIDDPIFTLGGDTAPGSDDNKDRGIEFRWHNGSSAKIGFFGLDDSTGNFTFIPDATNTSEVFSGTKGNVDITKLLTTDIDFVSPDTTHTITATMTNADTLSFEGDSGQLFSLTDSLTGTIFSVNDISGIPSIEVDDDGTIRFAEFAGNVLIGTATDNGTDILQVDGSITATAYKGTSPTITLTGAVTGSATMTDLGNVSIATTATSDPTLTINGDASGSATFTNLGNATLTLTIADDSHTHDGRYYTETEADARFVRINTGQTWTAIGGNALSFESADTIDTGSADQASLEVYQSTFGADAFMQFHVAGDYAKYFGLHGGINDFVVGGWSAGAAYQRIFHDGYHPNADKLTTARTITLGGDLSGSASFDGSANITITAAVADDSHNHSFSSGNFTVNGSALTVGSGTNSSTIYMTDADDSTRRIQTDSGRIGFLDTALNWSAYSKDDGDWIVEGNLGVGTASPSAKLDVVGDSELNGDIRVGGDGHNTNNLRDSQTTTNRSAQVQVNGVSGPSAGLSLVGWHSNVGGYYSPQLWLGKSNASDNAVGTNTIVSNGTDLGAINFAGNDGTTFFNAASIRAEVDGTPSAGSSMPGRLVFYTTPSGSTAPTEVVRIDSSGNVGIGTTSPLRNLHLNDGTTDSSSQVRFQNDARIWDVGVVGSIGDRFVIRDGTGSSDVVRIAAGAPGSTIDVDSSGNVGIGTTSPSAPLDVRGGDTSAVSIVTDGHIQLYEPTSTTRAYTFLSRDDSNSMVGGNFRLDAGVTTGSHVGYSKGTDQRGGSGIIFDNTSGGNYGSIIFLQNNDTDDDTWSVQEAMRITSSGNVGIGTTSPGVKLDVAGGAFQVKNTFPQAILTDSDSTNASDAGGAFIIRGSDNSQAARFAIPASNGKLQLESHYGDLAFFTDTSGSPVERVTIDGATGNVGIGTTSPSAPLDVVGNVEISSGTLTINDAGGENALRLIGTSPTIGLSDTDGDSFYIHVNANNFYVLADRDGTGAYGAWESPFPLQLESDTNTGYVFGNKILTTADEGSGNGLDADTLDGNDSSAFVAVTGDTMTGTLTYTLLNGPATSSRDKIRVYNSSSYAIGMQSGITFGGLNDWGMTFQMNNEGDRGFWWGDVSHTTAQGAMSLTTNGFLAVANGIRVGFGESDTATPASGLTVSGDMNVDSGTLFVDSTNNRVGIGTSSPSVPLEVSGKIYSSNDIVSGKGGGGVALTINDGYGNANVTFNHQGGTPEQNGNAARIEVNTDSTVGASMNFELLSNVTGGVSVGLTSILALSETQVTSYKPLVVTGDMNVGNNTLFVDESTNRVGIGTTSPTSLLHLASTGPVTLTLEADTDNLTETDTPTIAFKQDGGAVTGRIGLNSSNHAEFFNEYAGSLYLGTNNTTRLTIDSSGNVGIGTTSPSAKLDVVGTVEISDDLNVDSGTLFVDASANRVGINAGTSLASSLVVGNGTTAAEGIIIHGKTISSITLRSQDPDTSRISFNDGANTPKGKIEYNFANDYMSFMTGGGETFRINRSGTNSEMGIGTTNPTGVLHVVSSNSVDVLKLERSDINTYADFDFANNDFNIDIGDADGSDIDFLIKQRGTTRFAIDTSGDVGIGTTTPSGKLDVNGTVYMPALGTVGVGTNMRVVPTTGEVLRVTSSIKYKKDIEDVDDTLSESIIYDSRPVWFRGTSEADNALSPDDTEWSFWGFIAEEMHEIDPRMVDYRIDENGQLDPDGVMYDRFTVHLVKVAQKQKQTIEAQQTQIDQLTEQMNLLAQRLQALEDK